MWLLEKGIKSKDFNLSIIKKFYKMHFYQYFWAIHFTCTISEIIDLKVNVLEFTVSFFTHKEENEYPLYVL